MGVIEPKNKIVIQGNPEAVLEYKTASGSAIKPGDLVYISGENIISEGGAATGTANLGIGWVSYEHANSIVQPATIDTPYAENCPACPVIMHKSGLIIMAAVQDVTQGAPLTGQPTAGEMVTGTIGTNHIYAVALKTKTGAGRAPVLVI